LQKAKLTVRPFVQLARNGFLSACVLRGWGAAFDPRRLQLGDYIHLTTSFLAVGAEAGASYLLNHACSIVVRHRTASIFTLNLHFSNQATPIHPMTTTKLAFKGTWNEVKGKLKQKYAQLTDDDLLFSEGKDEELLGRLQKKLGETKERIRQTIAEL
jgi:uncharacterized protein YjbJ (UPF0337 family)